MNTADLKTDSEQPANPTSSPADELDKPASLSLPPFAPSSFPEHGAGIFDTDSAPVVEDLSPEQVAARAAVVPPLDLAYECTSSSIFPVLPEI